MNPTEPGAEISLSMEVPGLKEVTFISDFK